MKTSIALLAIVASTLFAAKTERVCTAIVGTDLVVCEVTTSFVPPVGGDAPKETAGAATRA